MTVFKRIASSFERGEYEPDTVRAWSNLFLIFLILVFGVGHTIALGTFFVAIQDTFNINREAAARVLNFLTLSFLMIGIIAGPISHHFGIKCTINAGFIISGISLTAAFIQPSSQSLWWLKVCFMLHGAGIGIVIPNLFQILSGDFLRHRGKAIVIFMSSTAFSGAVFPWIINHFIDVYGLRGTFLFIGAFAIQCITFTSLLKVRPIKTGLTSTPKPKNAKHGEYSETDSLKESTVVNKQPVELPPGKTLREKLVVILTNLKFYNLMFSQTMAISSFTTVITTIVDYGIDRKLSMPAASSLLVLHAVGEIFARVVTGWFLDRKYLSTQLITAFGQLFVSAVYVATSFADGILLQASVFFIGLFFGLCSTSRMVLLPLFGVDISAMIYGINTFSSGCFYAIVPNLIGVFRDHLGSYSYLYFLLSSLALVSGFFYFLEHWLTYKTRCCPTCVATSLDEQA